MTQNAQPAQISEYFRRDQNTGVTAPDLSKDCTYAEHIVHARGKRTQFTSVTLDASKCHDFGETTYRLKRPEVDNDGHLVVEHAQLISELEKVAREADKDERARAIQALRYARRRLEGLVNWKIDISRIERKNLITFAGGRIANYFSMV